MSAADLQALIIGVLQGLGATTAFLLVLFIGFCVILGFTKLRPTSRTTLVVRNLDELVGNRFAYLPADAPRGRTDQLSTPELLEAASRHRS